MYVYANWQARMNVGAGRRKCESAQARMDMGARRRKRGSVRESADADM